MRKAHSAFCSICKARKSGWENSKTAAAIWNRREFTITVRTGDRTTRSAHPPATHSFASDVTAGDRVLLADGAVELRAAKQRRQGGALRSSLAAAPIRDNQGINLPGVRISSPSLTDKDLADLRFGLAVGVDMVALSFVRTAEDVRHAAASA